MDIITCELDNLIVEYDFRGRVTDVACYNKIKLDYFLMLTIAATWDLKHSAMDAEKSGKVMRLLQRLETGKLIQLIDSGLNLDKTIVDIFNLYKEGRNHRFGHTTFDEFEAKRLNGECEQCWNAFMKLEAFADTGSEMVRRLYRDNNDFFYIASIKRNGDMLMRQFGNKSGNAKVSRLDIKARLSNKENEIREGDLFISVADCFVRVSPFIQYSENEGLFMMLMDIEREPLAFKMAYVYRTQYASESAKYLDEFPAELRGYFPEETKGPGKNGVQINRFSQYSLFEQEYYRGIHKGVQKRLDDFIVGNMAYGAVRGVGGVGKTSVVFMWMNRVLNNEDGILDSIRESFNLRRIIFLSAKTKIYSREINEKNLSNFYDIGSDVCSYSDVIERIYAMYHPSEKAGITFKEKEDYIKNYSNQSCGLLVVIDDYESLPEESRKQIQELKDSLRPNIIKLLITTRFTSKESKDIIVERLSQDDCAKMTDHIFPDTRWRSDITCGEMHQLTGGLPLLIWYAKAFYQMGQLSSERLKGSYSGPAKGLEAYLYDNFVDCFADVFTRNFLMIATKYYKAQNALQVSKRTAAFLCMENPKEYKAEDEEFYFQELVDLKLVAINQTTGLADFSPLMNYMDRATRTQEPQHQYQEDGLKILAQLDEEHFKDLEAVMEAAEYLENETKCRVLERIVAFTQNEDVSGKESVKILAVERLFALSSQKFKFYQENEQLFQNHQVLMKAMLTYLLEDKAAMIGNYEPIRDFVYSISVSMETHDLAEQTVLKGADLVSELLFQSLNERELETISNLELEKRAQLLRSLAVKLIDRQQDEEKKANYIDQMNDLIDAVCLYCEVPKIG